MPQKRHYDVMYRFPVRVKGDLVWVDRSKAGEIEELLTEEQIKEHIKAGNLVDNGAVIPVSIAEAPAPASTEFPKKAS